MLSIRLKVSWRETIGKKTNAVTVLLRKMLASSEVIQPEVGKYTVMNEKDITF